MSRPRVNCARCDFPIGEGKHSGKEWCEACVVREAKRLERAWARKSRAD